MLLLNFLEILIGLFWLAAAAAWFAAAFARVPPPGAPAPAQRPNRWTRFAAICAALAAFTQFAELVLAHAGVSIGPLQ